MQLKEAWGAKDGYCDGVVAVDFYKAVLDFAVKTKKDFERYLRSKKPK